MTGPKSQPALPHAQYERFESMLLLEDMFDELVRETQREIRIFDRALTARYNSSARCTLLREFLRADTLNRIFIIVHEPENMARTLPGFLALVEQFGHAVTMRQTPRTERHIHDPFCLFDASHYVHRFHYDRMRFARGRNELAGAQMLLDRFGELWDVSTPLAPGGVLGL